MNYENFRKFINELTDIVFRERFVILSFIMAAILIKSFFYYLDFRSQTQAVNLEVAAFPEEEQSGFASNNASQNANFSNSELFPFDPMIVSYEDLVRLGFSEKTAHIFINYRSKGGRFFKKEDIKKIYGVSPQLYSRIEPYISIGNAGYSNNSFSNFEKKQPLPIDINTASIEEWKSLPGIGDFFAKKMVMTRDGLGAFVAISQIQETYGLADSTFQKIKPYLKISKKPIKKININEAEPEILRAHPYILKWQADEILRKRPIYGLNDLYELKSFSDRKKWKKIEPYFEF